MNNALGNLIKKIRKEQNLSLREFAALCNLSHSYVDKLENGFDPKTHKPIIPSIETLKKISVAINTSLEELLEAAGYLDKKEMREENDLHHVPMVKVPVVKNIHHDQSLITSNNIEGYELVEAERVKNGDYFFLRVNDDSMAGSRIHSQDLVLVHKQNDVENGEIALVIVNKEKASLKRVKKSKGMVFLYPDNPNHEVLAVREDDVKVIGKVVEGRYKIE